jgi:hypothetical protein
MTSSLELRQQQLREQKMAHVVDAKYLFKSACRQAARTRQACVVDQDVKRKPKAQKSLGTSFYRMQVAKVKWQPFHLPNRGHGGSGIRNRHQGGPGPDFVQNHLGSFLRQTCQKHPRTMASQFSSRHAAYACVGAGDQGNFSVQVWQVQRGDVHGVIIFG